LKRFNVIACLFVLLLNSSISFCQYANIEFIENKGQWDTKVKFKGAINNGAFFLQERGFRVLQHNAEDVHQLTEYFHHSKDKPAARTSVALPPVGEDQFLIRSHAYDVRFVNAATPAIAPDKPLDSYNNYIIGNDPTKWKSNCKIYQAVLYNSIYEGIDVRYYTSEGNLKYDIIVHPGANVSQVAMRYEGVDELQVKDEQLVIKTSVGETRELAPYAFQVINGIKKEVHCRFKTTGNTVYFALNNYSKSHTLVIDPTVVFASFTGSSTDNWGYTATYGPDGSLYAGGIVFSTGFPVTTGAFQTNFNGGVKDEEALKDGYDIGIIKFNARGTSRIYATYVGGAGNEQPHSLIVDAAGNLVIAGRSNSNNYPVTGLTIGSGGGYDIILTKLNPSGSALAGSRKIGGTAYDGVNIRPKYANPKGVETIRRNYGDDARSEVIFDAAGNILLASNTQSSNFPTVSAFQTALSGRQDGVFLKMTPDLATVLASSYIGGGGDDAAFVLALNPSDNTIYLGGNTTSGDLPGDKTGVIYPSLQGSGTTDGFVSILSAGGTSLLKTTYMGTAGQDMLYGIQFDKFGFPYIMGTTTGTWPITNVGFYQSGGKQFISKLKKDLSGFEYSTAFGAPGSQTPNISPVAFLVDRCENVYLSGWGGAANSSPGFPTGGTTGLPVTADAVQKSTDNSDFYFFVLERDATRQLYGSFFGQFGGYGEHVDGGTSRFDRNGVIYQAMCANCGRDVRFPTTPGVWAPTNGSSECNLAALKIAFNLSGVAASIRASIEGVIADTLGCAPLTVEFTDTLNAAQSYLWNFGDGTPEIRTLTNSIIHTFNVVGDYRVRLIAVDSSKCNLSDTAYVTIKVRTYKAVLGFKPKKLDPCDSFNYKFINTSFVDPAERSFNKSSFTWDFGDNSPPVVAGLDTIKHNFPGPGHYTVKLSLADTNFCNAPVTFIDTLRIAANVKAQFTTQERGCAPYHAIFENTSEAGEDFYWDFGDGTTSSEFQPVHVYAIPGTYTVTLKVVDSGTCNKVDFSAPFTVTVSDKPRAAFTYSPQPPQENTPVQFINNSTGAEKYIWNFGDEESLSTSSPAPVQHIYNETNTFNAELVAINIYGCPDTARAIIQARVSPLLDVPSAFTPNGDGINDQVTIRGFGIAKMTWRIYNRWGGVVFETSDRHQGWDGRYKGAVLPAEVYHFTLDVEYSDKTRFQKKGDITLLR
jgi:gliding motility-associated-like protein